MTKELTSRLNKQSRFGVAWRRLTTQLASVSCVNEFLTACALAQPRPERKFAML